MDRFELPSHNIWKTTIAVRAARTIALRIEPEAALTFDARASEPMPLRIGKLALVCQDGLPVSLARLRDGLARRDHGRRVVRFALLQLAHSLAGALIRLVRRLCARPAVGLDHLVWRCWLHRAEAGVAPALPGGNPGELLLLNPTATWRNSPTTTSPHRYLL